MNYYMTLSRMLLANGHKEDEDPQTVLNIELAMEAEDFQLEGLSFFRNLTSLSLVNMRLKSLNHFSQLPTFKFVKNLSLSENYLTDLKDLDTFFPSLEELNFEFNHVSNIHSLSQLDNLKVIRGGSNKITSLNGLTKSLIHLSMPTNSIGDDAVIDFIGSLGDHSSLQKINLSGNPLLKVETATCVLSVCKNLQSLYFADDDWGRCPLTRSPSYLIYMHALSEKFPGFILDGSPTSDARDSINRKREWYFSQSRETFACCYQSTGNFSDVNKWSDAFDSPNGDSNHKEFSGAFFWQAERPLSCLERPGGLGRSALSGDHHEWNDNVDLHAVTAASFIEHSTLPDLSFCVKLRVLKISACALILIPSCIGSLNLNEIDISRNLLTSLSGLPSSLTRVIASGNKIDNISDSILPNVQCLALDFNALDDTAIIKLNGLENLVELYLGGNKLEKIDQFAIGFNLRVIDVRWNSFCEVGEPTVGDFLIYNLKNLEICNGLAVTAEERCRVNDQMTGLVTEEFLNDRLKSFDLKALTFLDLSNCDIVRIGQLFNDNTMPLVTDISLAYNAIKSMKGFGPMTSLVRINLNSNKLSSFEYSALTGCTALRVLELSSNRFRSLDGISSFCNSKHIKVLHLNDNRLQSTEELCHFEELRELALNGNELRLIDQKTLNKLGSTLERLHLASNSLKVLEGFEVLRKLKVINLSANRIADITEIQRLSGCHYLEEIWLVQNPITRKHLFRFCIMRTLPTIQKIDGENVTEKARQSLAEIVALEANAPPVHSFKIQLIG